MSFFAWDMVKRPFHKGGLGLRLLLGFNKVLQGKWLWRFMGEKESF